jgi:hypothetical protein
MVNFTPVPKPPPREKKSRSRLRPRSRRVEQLYAGESGRVALVARLLAAHPLCQLGDVLQSFTVADAKHSAFRCERFAAHVHELKTRGRGGDVLDEENCRTACAACHRFVHEHPKIALALGLLRRGT